MYSTLSYVPRPWRVLTLAVFSSYASAENVIDSESAAGVSCSDAWYRATESRLVSGDGQGHGPDLGSEEWKSVIEYKLGIRGQADIPPRNSDEWCRYVDTLIAKKSVTGSAVGLSSGAGDTHEGPSFSCDKAEAGSTEAMICADPELSALDRTLAGVYKAAVTKAVNQHPPMLRAEQRGWIKGRNDCWKSTDQRSCVKHEYERRIVELQAQYRLVDFTGPVQFICEGNPANEVIVTFFNTEPPTLIAERGDRVSLMFIQPSASGSKYQGGNEMFWEHQGEARITWGYQAPEMRCVKSP
ncbi:MAG: MliC family protein [Candidatus Thiodiazotropha sp.]